MLTGVTMIIWKNLCDRAFCYGFLRNYAPVSHLPSYLGL
jgi:hypothetical protein